MRKDLYREHTADFPRLKTDRFFADGANRWQLRGAAADAMRFTEERQLLRPELWRRFVQQFREDADFDRGWKGEFWGKMMRGASFVYACTRSEALYATLRQTVLDVLESADENGRISSYAVGHELQGWDMWSRKYVLLGMQYFLEVCEEDALKERIVRSMCAQLDYIIERIGPKSEGKTPIGATSQTWRGLNSSSILEPVVRLYDITGEQRYLDFAAYIVGTGGTRIANLVTLALDRDLYPYQYPVTKAYEMTSFFEGVLEYYRATGEERLREAVVNYAERVLESDFTVIGSAGCTHELFDHSTVRQANTTCVPPQQETCVTVTLMKFFYQLLLLTGEAKYADAFERAFYNAYLGAINVRGEIEEKTRQDERHPIIEPMPFDGYSPLTAARRGCQIGGMQVMSDRHYYGCCASIASAGVGLVPKVQLLSTENGFALSLFLDGTVSSRTPSGRAVTFETKTAYPADGRIEIAVHPEAEEAFELLVRNPAWSKTTALTVNGEPAAVTEGYIRLARTWRDGDTLVLTLDMRTEAIYPIPYGKEILHHRVVWGEDYVVPTLDREDPLAHRHIALRRGPLMLAQDERLGYGTDVPVAPVVGADGFVAVEPADVPYPHLAAFTVPLKDGSRLPVTDYASAGKDWKNAVAVWMLTE